MDPHKGKRGKTVIIPGAESMSRAELQEIVHASNEQHNTHHSEDDVSRQFEERAKGQFGKKPSLKRKRETGKWV